MAKKKGKKRSGKKKIPILASAGLAISGYQAFQVATKASDPGKALMRQTFGIVDGKFQPTAENSFAILIPTLVGIAGSMIASRTGVNRYLPKGLPFKL